MDLQQVVQQQNKERSEKISNTLDLIHEELELVIIAILDKRDELDRLDIDIKWQANQKLDLENEIRQLQSEQSHLVETHTDEINSLELQYDRLTKLISDSQKLYTEEVQKRNILHDDIEDEERDLKERETALKIKVEAFKLERQEFNIEKRRQIAIDTL